MNESAARKAAELVNAVLRLQAQQKKWLTAGGVNAMKPAFALAAELEAAYQTVAPPPEPRGTWEQQAFIVLAALKESVDWELEPSILQDIARLVESYGVAPAVSTPRCPKCGSSRELNEILYDSGREPNSRVWACCSDCGSKFNLAKWKDLAQFFQPAPPSPPVSAEPASSHKPWCASVPRPMDGVMGRGPYRCDCGAVAPPLSQGESK